MRFRMYSTVSWGIECGVVYEVFAFIFRRSSMIWLAAIIVLMGLYTQSLQKMVATYFFGMFVICGVLLPDWEFFNRSVYQWCTPVTIPDVGSQSTDQKPSSPTR
ncbi:peptidase [Abeliophyllum distichum]|uniref:Peptidase n=1 Tax=Abeliophyllum distichum TaxID=126358 RepID=A0ABD1U014_9LAMI